MKVFSKILLESKNDVFILTSDEFNRYKEAISKTKRSKEFMNLLWIVSQYPVLLEKDVLEDVLKGKYTQKVSSIDSNILKDITKLAKRVGDEVRLLPQLLSLSQREAVIDKRIDPNDLTLDLETEQGRNAIAKKYIPLIEKLVKQFEDRKSVV